MHAHENAALPALGPSVSRSMARRLGCLCVPSSDDCIHRVNIARRQATKYETNFHETTLCTVFAFVHDDHALENVKPEPFLCFGLFSNKEINVRNLFPQIFKILSQRSLPTLVPHSLEEAEKGRGWRGRGTYFFHLALLSYSIRARDVVAF